MISDKSDNCGFVFYIGNTWKSICAESETKVYIYQPLRTGRMQHKVNF